MSDATASSSVQRLRTLLYSSAATAGASLVRFLLSDVGAIARTIRERLTETIHATDFGVLFDDATNNTAALQAAIDALTARGGGTLLLAIGTARHTGVTLDATTSIRIKGQGWASILKNTGNNPSITIGAAAADRTADCRVQDCIIDAITGAATQHGVSLLRCHSPKLENIRIRNHGGNGIETDRAYATWYEHVYSNNNTGSGFHAGPLVGADGNDNILIRDCRFLANGAKGIHIEGSCPGLNLTGNDIEGNAVGLQIDAGTGGQSEAVVIEGNYFESQVGKNISIGEDGGATRFIEGLELIANVFNPTGGGSAAANKVALDRITRGSIHSNHFSTVDLVYVSNNVTQLHLARNKYSAATGPAGATDPTGGFDRAAVGALLQKVFAPIGWNTRHRVGASYSGDKMVVAANLLMTGDAAGTQDDATVGSAALMLGANVGRLVRCAAGGGAALSVPLKFDADGLTIVALKVDIIATAALPAAGATQDGRIVIEDTGALRNIVFYGVGQRFRILGGAAF